MRLQYLFHIILLLLCTCVLPDVEPDYNTETEPVIVGYELKFKKILDYNDDPQNDERKLLSVSTDINIDIDLDGQMKFIFEIYKLEKKRFLKDGRKNKKEHREGDLESGEPIKTLLTKDEIEGKFEASISDVTAPQIKVKEAMWDDVDNGFKIETEANPPVPRRINDCKLVLEVTNKENGMSTLSNEYHFEIA